MNYLTSVQQVFRATKLLREMAKQNTAKLDEEYAQALGDLETTKAVILNMSGTELLAFIQLQVVHPDPRMRALFSELKDTAFNEGLRRIGR